MSDDWAEFFKQVQPLVQLGPLSDALKALANDEHSEQELWDRLHPSLRAIISGDDPA